MGLLYALCWDKDLGIQNVTFELDSKTVVDAIKNPREGIRVWISYREMQSPPSWQQLKLYG